MKNKQTSITPARRESLLSHIGVAVLALAAVLTVVELDHARPKAMATDTTISNFVQQADKGSAAHHEPMRKDKEEIRHMTHSYGVMMRSHPTAGTA